jgi:hypothetical protein
VYVHGRDHPRFERVKATDKAEVESVVHTLS